MSAPGLSRRALFGAGLARVREHFDAEAGAPPVAAAPDPVAAARDFWSGGHASRVEDWCAPVAPVLVAALDLPAAGPPPTVLDAAAGRGHVAAAAAARGARAVAVDLAPTVVARAAGRGDDAVTWLTGDVAALPLGDDAVDAVASSFGVVYATDARAATDELRRVLRPGGRMALATWDPAGAMGAVLRAARAADPARFGRARPERWGTYDGLLYALDRFPSFDMEGRTMTWRAPDADGLRAALAGPPGPLSRGKVDRDEVEAALARHLRATPQGLELDVSWWLVRVAG